MLSRAVSCLLLSASTLALAEASARADTASRAIALLSERVAGVSWSPDKAARADVTYDGREDVVVLGTRGEELYVAVVAGPISATSKHWVLHFRQDPGAEDGLCAPPEQVELSLEPPGLPLEEWGCDAESRSDECLQASRTQKRLDAAARAGGRGILLRAGECDAFHLFFEDGRLTSWRR